MPFFSKADELKPVYVAIGDVLSDEDLNDLVREVTGEDIYNLWAAQGDQRWVRLKKVIEALRESGGYRWVLTAVLIHIAAQDKLREKQDKLNAAIVGAFPKTLMGLPQAESHVSKAVRYLRELFTSLADPVRLGLLPKRPGLENIMQSIVTLLAYKTLHDYLLLLLFRLSSNEALLAETSPDVEPNLELVARQIEAFVKEAPATLALLDPAVTGPIKLIEDLAPFANAVRASAAQPDEAAGAIDSVQRVVRQKLWWLNGEIFRTVRQVTQETFKPLTSDFPTVIEDRREFPELVQVVRDLAATVLARALKHKLWQEAESQVSIVGSYFDVPAEPEQMIKDWLWLRTRVGWLAQLEAAQQLSEEAKEHIAEIDNEIFKQQQFDDDARMHFNAYRKWFARPFKSIDDALREDCGSLRKMDDPLNDILKELQL